MKMFLGEYHSVHISKLGLKQNSSQTSAQDAMQPLPGQYAAQPLSALDSLQSLSALDSLQSLPAQDTLQSLPAKDAAHFAAEKTSEDLTQKTYYSPDMAFGSNSANAKIACRKSASGLNNSQSSGQDTCIVLNTKSKFSSTTISDSKPSTNTEYTAWKDCPFNSVVTIISVLLCIFSLKDFTSILVPLLDGLLGWRGNVKIEESIPMTRKRDFISSTLVIPFCLIIGRYQIYNPEFIQHVKMYQKTLQIIGVFVAYRILRNIIQKYILGQPHRGETSLAISNTSRSYFIILNIFMMPTVFIMTLCGAGDRTIASAILYVIAIIYGIFLFRKGQILRSFNNPIATFLYICTLELIPTGILIATAIML